MENYVVVIEKSQTGFSAFSPDVPGCITVGETVENTLANMREALELYIEETVEEGREIPTPKGLEYHIENGLLNSGNIADDYFLTRIELPFTQTSMARL